MRNICTNQGVVGSRGFDTVLGVHNADGPTWGSFLPILGRSGQSPVLSLTEEGKNSLDQSSGSSWTLVM